MRRGNPGRASCIADRGDGRPRATTSSAPVPSSTPRGSATPSDRRGRRRRPDRAAAPGPRDRRFRAAGRDHPLRVSRGHDPERPRLAGRPRGARLVRDRAGQHLRARPDRPRALPSGRHEALGGPGPRPRARAADPLTVRGADPAATTRLGYHVEALHGPDDVGRAAGRASTTPTPRRCTASRPLSATSSSRTTSGRSSASTARGCS